MIQLSILESVPSIETKEEPSFKSYRLTMAAFWWLRNIKDCENVGFNTYPYWAQWETDAIGIVRASQFMHEIEIKISRSDFKADFKKGDKHQYINRIRMM